MTSAVEDIADIDGLGIDTDPADSFNCFLYRGAFLQVDILHGHYASRTVLGIAQQMVDLAAGICVRICKDTLDDISGHFLHKVRSIIGHQVIDNAGSFFI